MHTVARLTISRAQLPQWRMQAYPHEYLWRSAPRLSCRIDFRLRGHRVWAFPNVDQMRRENLLYPHNPKMTSTDATVLA